MTSSLLAFLSVSLIVIVIPGPDTAVTVRNTLIGGFSGGICTALEIAAGQASWALATSIGIVALLVESAPLFEALKYAGAAYLIFLGVQALWGAGRFRGGVWSASPLRTPRPSGRLAPITALRQGLISDLGNPKMAMFFASLLPQFVPPGRAIFSALLGLGLTFCVMTFVWLAAYTFAVAKARDLFRRSSIRRVIEGLSGAILIGLGLRIATENR
jgi:threonine/homoserine/homoserine lactone efflux protein